MQQKSFERRTSETIHDLGEKGGRYTEEMSSKAVEGLRQYQLKFLSAMQDNMNATMEYAQDVLQANSVSEVLEVSTSHSRRQLEMMGEQAREMGEQARELSSSALNMVTNGAQPMAIFGNVMKGTS